MLRTPAPLERSRNALVGDVVVGPGERVPFVLTWYPSYEPLLVAIDAEHEVELTESWWRDWVSRCTYGGPWRAEVVRSLITVKDANLPAVRRDVAAATTSLPEAIGGVRNWGYRFCWLRDATYTLMALLGAGFEAEAVAWRDWLLRAIAGDPGQAQIMYGVGGERRLDEWELPWLPGKVVPPKDAAAVGHAAGPPALPRKRVAAARQGPVGGARHPPAPTRR